MEQGSSRRVGDILQKIDALKDGLPPSERTIELIADEPAPSEKTIASAREFLVLVWDEELPDPDVACYWGEITLTWRRSGKLVQLTEYPDGGWRVYWQVDAEPPATRARSTRSHHRGSSVAALIERLRWLKVGEEHVMTTEPKMVTCKRCGLLVGWSDEEVKTFYCIPCFDHVELKKEGKQ